MEALVQLARYSWQRAFYFPAADSVAANVRPSMYTFCNATFIFVDLKHSKKVRFGHESN